LFEAPTGGEGATYRSWAHCPWMGMNSLKAIAESLEQGRIEHGRYAAQKSVSPPEPHAGFCHPVEHTGQRERLTV